jgi:lipoyl synthase
MLSETRLRLPEWIKVSLPRNSSFGKTQRAIKDLGLHTVCTSARCPNIFECFSKGTGTFLIMGERCTRTCAFCNIGAGIPEPLQEDEPARIARAVGILELSHVVITSVTRDDLQDGGAAHFAATIGEIRKRLPGVKVEVLIPDFQGSSDALRRVVDAGPDVLNHNLETVPRLYPNIRPQALYQGSLELLSRAKSMGQLRTKSGLMVGLGEKKREVREVLKDLSRVSCDMVTIGQYLRPSKKHAEVVKYVHPDEFRIFDRIGKELGIPHMFCGPLVRSSYHAEELSGLSGDNPV